jgi:hypothetical protein
MAPAAGGTDYVALITALAPLVTAGAPIVAQMVNQIQGQSGKAADTILAETGVQCDANDAKLIADLAAEQKAIEGGAK